MTPISADRAKSLAKLLRHDLTAAGFDIPHALALELVAHQHGAKSWNVLAASGAAAERATRPEMSPGVPVLRVMSAEVALRFYVDLPGLLARLGAPVRAGVSALCAGVAGEGDTAPVRTSR